MYTDDCEEIILNDVLKLFKCTTSVHVATMIWLRESGHRGTLIAGL